MQNSILPSFLIYLSLLAFCTAWFEQAAAQVKNCLFSFLFVPFHINLPTKGEGLDKSHIWTATNWKGRKLPYVTSGWNPLSETQWPNLATESELDIWGTCDHFPDFNPTTLLSPHPSPPSVKSRGRLAALVGEHFHFSRVPPRPTSFFTWRRNQPTHIKLPGEILPFHQLSLYNSPGKAVKI